MSEVVPDFASWSAQLVRLWVEISADVAAATLPPCDQLEILRALGTELQLTLQQWGGVDGADDKVGHDLPAAREP